MRLIRGLHNLRPADRGCVATIGNFDGVHLGHRAVFQRLLARGRETPDEVEARVQRAQAFEPPRGLAHIEIHNDSTLEKAGQQLLATLQQAPGWPA